MRSRNTTLRAQLTAVTFAAALGSTACISLEIDVPDVCVRQQKVPMFSLPADTLDDFDGEIEQTFTMKGVDLLSQLEENGIDAEAALHGITIAATDKWMPTLGFIDEAFATLKPMGSTLDPIELGCQRGECDAIGRELELAPETITSIIDYLQSEELELTVRLAGALPTQDWAVDVDVCMSSNVKFERGF